MVRWCSGYHVCFTRRRSRVQASLEPLLFLFPSTEEKETFLFHSLAIELKMISGRWVSLLSRCSAAGPHSTGKWLDRNSSLLIVVLVWKNTISANDEEILANVMSKTINFNLLPKISADCRDALMAMLERDPNKRISASELLQHPWIKVSSIYHWHVHSLAVISSEKCKDGWNLLMKHYWRDVARRERRVNSRY